PRPRTRRPGDGPRRAVRARSRRRARRCASPPARSPARRELRSRRAHLGARPGGPQVGSPPSLSLSCVAVPALPLSVDPHPLLHLGVLVAELPAPIAEMPSPDWLVKMLAPGADLPVHADDAIRT